MEKKYFYVDNLHEYGRKLSCKTKLSPTHWNFTELEEGIYCLYNKKTGKIVMSRKHPEDKPDFYIAFAICYHKIMGWAEPKEKLHVIKKAAAHLKIGEIFYSGESERPLRCCGHSKYGDVLYEFDGGSNTNIYRLNSSMIIYIKKENK